MALQNLQAVAHPDGNRIDLSWELPAADGFIGARVMRRRGSYPLSPADGVLVGEGAAVSVQDENLQGECVYYYMVFPYKNDPPDYHIDSKNRIACMATSPQGFAARMYALLPAIYHRYDKDTQALQRFLQLIGGQLDQWYSYAKATTQLKDLRNVSGHLLPLLAEWIAWRTDNKLEFSNQRREIRNAPALYKTTGLVPVVETTVKRITDWESRSKEFVHNIFASNRPERLNLWHKQRDNAGVWNAPQPLSMDYAFEGRPSFTIDTQGVQWLFYHTRRRRRWEIWYKSAPLYRLDLRWLDEVQAGPVNEGLMAALADAGLALNLGASLAQVSGQWEISDAPERYRIEVQSDHMRVYHVTAPPGVLAASAPLIASSEPYYIYKYPCVVSHEQNLWLFYSRYDENNGHWRIQYRRRAGGVWTADYPQSGDLAADIANNPFASGGVYDDTPQRRQAYATVDQNDNLWVFWLEHNGTDWRLRYNRRPDGGVWSGSLDFPLDAGLEPRVNGDLQVLAQGARLLVFWSRYEDTATPGQRRYSVVYRVKNDLNADLANWSSVQALPKHALDDNHHDREAFARDDGGDVEVFFSSNRSDSGWSVWRTVLTDALGGVWDNAQTERLSEPQYAQRDPVVFDFSGTLWLLYHASNALSYNSALYRATQTYDERYAGCVLTDTRHAQQRLLYGEFNDYQHYSYDSGPDGVRSNEDRIARDTLGVYLNTLTLDSDEIANGLARLKPVLKEFMPLTDRAVFITQQDTHSEYVLATLVSSYSDLFSSVLSVSALDENEDFSDELIT